MNLNSSSPLVRWGIAFGPAVGYLLLFPLLERVFGPAATTLVAFPVAVITWYFGLLAGLIASLLSIPLNALLYTIVLASGWDLWVETSWAGNIMVVLVGYIAGRLHNEFIERERVVYELRSRERYLTLVKITISDILSPKNADERYDYLLTRLSNLFVADYAYFIRWDATLEQAIFTASTVPSDQSILGAILAPNGSALIETVLRSEHPLVIDDLSGDPVGLSSLSL